MTDEATFCAFVAARSRGLMRTAYLLTHDEGMAEDLLQTALTKAWFAWDRLDDDPQRYVRRVLVTTSVSWCVAAGGTSCRPMLCRNCREPVGWMTGQPRRTSGSRSGASRCDSARWSSCATTRT